METTTLKRKRYYNLGSPKRVKPKSSKIKTPSYKRKHNIGRPAKVAVTPDTPRSNKWKKIREKTGYKNYEISDYEDDDEDKDEDKAETVMENESEDPSRTYTTFEETVTPYMEYALQKKPFTRSSPTDSQIDVDEEAWMQKIDDSPNKNYPEPPRLLPGKRPRRTSSTRRSNRRSKSRSKSRSRSRRTRGGG
jgi:hypothetical protein